MLKNYLKIAWRNIRKQKFYSFLNIFGLSLGLASCLLITLYVVDELSFDRSFDHADRIYRVNSDIRFGGADMKLAVAPDPLAFTMMKDYPQVEAATRLREDGSALVRRNGSTENLKEELVAYADSTFFKVFSVPLVSGDARTALTNPNTMVISERDAKKYFGSENPMGKTLLLDNERTFTITGVMKNIPDHSHLSDLHMMLSMSTNPDSRDNNWGSHNFLTYFLLKEGVDQASFEKHFDTVIEKYTSLWVRQIMNATMAEMRKSGSYIKYSLIPLTDIHLHSDRSAEISTNGNVQYVYIFGVVAIFLLGIACVNFMNLATARSANRAKEVGVRKALGSKRSYLVGQFLTEAVMLSFLSLIFGIILAYATLPLFNNLASKQIIFPFGSGIFWAIAVLTGICVGLLAGSYPAFFLSAFKPLTVLRGAIEHNGKGGYLRNSLVVFQFMVSVMLIIGTGVIYNQLNYIQTKKLGFEKDQVLIVKNAYALDTKARAFKDEVAQMPNVKRSTLSSFLPTPSSRTDNTFFPQGQLQQDKGINMQKWAVDYDYIKTLNLKMKLGRAFQKDFPSDSSGIIINETAAKILGYANPIGKQIYDFEFNSNKKDKTYTILGVVSNFHFESLRKNIGALSLTLQPSYGLVAISLEGGNYINTINQVQALWKQMAPGQPFNYRFMDEDFDNVYRSEQRIGQIFITFAVISILIGCLGLFGLSAYTAERRTKEIGVRKVLGASVSNIVALLSKDFLKLVLLSIVIGSPIAWYGMNTWLKEFAYHIDIAWWMFALAGLLAIVIALLTVSFQSIKAALMNPVKSLKSE
ncbi:ABC transporter permease [Dyadobacter arcticus]|uniref:ABC transport system permease protein n=1 Tax=Dyadobacter arcticus TaxID=1078754 RepID=A0ABX0UIC4_9BACT|nr:ABC transporter permease [Dyadobacter arcticus]NIJ51809.1 putative ABC transport system permease protein [Dyadobacter arcticus]